MTSNNDRLKSYSPTSNKSLLADAIRNYQPPPYTGPLITWGGISGIQRDFQIDWIGAIFYAVAGVYIFCRQGTNGLWYPAYIGETDSFKRRLTDEIDSHHRIDCIRRFGATHVCTLGVVGELTARLIIETDLRQRLQPPCNRQ